MIRSSHHLRATHPAASQVPGMPRLLSWGYCLEHFYQAALLVNATPVPAPSSRAKRCAWLS
ncbi:hypothetical protein XAP412_1390006 [Xanthomonas phaseoli pv. phaseoli]|nr:hypothetical protein XAP412_1390006 [Xanthomonas phaseoli pv. phaseoli]